MRAPDDVKAALEAIGFEATDVVPNDDPAYTKFRRGNEVFDIVFGVEGKAMSIFDVMDELVSEMDKNLKIEGTPEKKKHWWDGGK